VTDLSQWTKNEIKKLGSLSKLAKALNLTRQAVMSWRDGEVITLSDKSAISIANYLSCSLDEVRSMFGVELQNAESVVVLTAKVARLERIVTKLVDAVGVSINESI
jgi:transcriptional accessory protein Tex/SPT6